MRCQNLQISSDFIFQYCLCLLSEQLVFLLSYLRHVVYSIQSCQHLENICYLVVREKIMLCCLFFEVLLFNSPANMARSVYKRTSSKKKFQNHQNISIMQERKRKTSGPSSKDRSQLWLPKMLITTRRNGVMTKQLLLPAFRLYIYSSKQKGHIFTKIGLFFLQNALMQSQPPGT